MCPTTEFCEGCARFTRRRGAASETPRRGGWANRESAVREALRKKNYEQARDANVEKNTPTPIESTLFLTQRTDMINEAKPHFKIADLLNLDPSEWPLRCVCFDEGGTVPLLPGYRKEMTGSMDEVQIIQIRDEITPARWNNAVKAF